MQNLWLSRRACLAASPLVVAPALRAAAPVWDADFVQNWRTSKEFTLAVAEAMPEGKYAFRPNAEEMTFGALMVHIGASQAFRFAQILGEKAPFVAPGPSAEQKSGITTFLARSFDYCVGAIPKFTAAQMDQQFKVDWYGRPMVSGRQLVLGMFTHTAHHRGQAEVYLRSCGIKPPDYRF